ncbi:hypothetical protein OJE16_01570 [Pantoea tagorei]
MSVSLEQLIDKYPEANAWAFGDSAELADRLVTLVIAGKKNGELRLTADVAG